MENFCSFTCCLLSTLSSSWKYSQFNYLSRYNIARCLSELFELVPHPHTRGRVTCYLNWFHDSLVIIPKCYKDVYVNSFFPDTARLQNYLPTESFPLTYDINNFKSRPNKHFILSLGSLQTAFVYAFHLFLLLSIFLIFLKLHALWWLFTLHQVNPNKKKIKTGFYVHGFLYELFSFQILKHIFVQQSNNCRYNLLNILNRLGTQSLV